MNPRRPLWTVLIALATLCGASAVWYRAPILPFGLCAYVVLALISGGAFYLLISRRPGNTYLLLSATALSPFLIATLGTLGLMAGASARLTALLLVFLSGAAGLLALYRRPPLQPEPRLTRTQAAALVFLLAAVVAAISYPAFAREWWRMRADAWFHAAVIAQIADYGIPPEDPYAAGLPLRYMWFYHVFIHLVSSASGIGPFIVMALANAWAMVGFGLAAFLLSSKLKNSFSHNYASVITAIFGMNAAFWVFLPLKFMRVFTGEVRGMEDLERLLGLQPLDVTQVRRFVQVGYNQEWMLDKFMVATAFSLGLCLMALLWHAAVKYVSESRREDLILSCAAALGVMVIHTALGSVVFAGVMGAAALLFVFRKLRWGASPRPFFNLFAALAACGLLLLPYLYSVSRATGEQQTMPIGFQGLKMIGLATSCAMVIFLAAFQVRTLLRARDIAARFALVTTASVIAVCTLMNLPSANSYDKLPFLPFFPLAVVGGWTIADFAARGANPARKRLRFILAAVALFAPLNLLMFAGYYATPARHRMNANEKQVAAWIRAHTSRDALMFDTNQRVFLLVAGPRRYYLGSEGYARIWGYDEREIAKRMRIVTDIYSPGPLEEETVETLAETGNPLYVLVRRDDPDVDPGRFASEERLFELVFSNGPISVYRLHLDQARASDSRGSTLE